MFSALQTGLLAIWTSRPLFYSSLTALILCMPYLLPKKTLSFLLHPIVFHPPKQSLPPKDQVPLVEIKSTNSKITYAYMLSYPLYVFSIFLQFCIREEEKILIYTHGNACDIYTMYPFLKFLRDTLRINVLAWEYEGYGPSRKMSKPSEQAIFDSADSVYEHVRKLGYKDENIILYGTSMGSAPALYMAHKYNKIARVALEAPFTSIARVKTDIYLKRMFDMFENIDRIAQVQAKLMVMHGTVDRIVPISHGKQLYAMAKRPYKVL